MSILPKVVDTTNKMLNAQARRYYNNNIRRAESKPIFVTVYHQSRADSTVSKGLGQTHDTSGNNSSLRFIKINNVPIYGFKEFNRETRKTEYKGISLQLENEGLIPSTLALIVGDFIEINQPRRDGNSATLIFNVNLSDPNHIFDEPHHRIAYNFVYMKEKDQNKWNELQGNIIEECDYIMDNVGGNKATLLRVEVVKQLKELAALFATLNNSYMDTFYDSINNLLVHNAICDDNPEHIINMVYYSPMVVEFQRRLRPIMFEFTNTYVQELILTHEVMGYFEFNDTLYGDLFKDKDLLFSGTYHYYNPEEFKAGGKYVSLVKSFFKDRYLSTLNQYKEARQTVMVVEAPSKMAISKRIKDLNSNVIAVSDSEIEKYKETFKKDIDPDAKIIQNIIAVSLNISPSFIIETLKNFKFEDTIENYLYGPVLLYFLKVTIEGMQKDARSLLEL